MASCRTTTDYCSPSSSIDSSKHPTLSSTSSLSNTLDLSTDLRLGLTISISDHQHGPSSLRYREQPVLLDWAVLAADADGEEKMDQWINKYIYNDGWCSSSSCSSSLFVKVYMEGIPIGRKLDLLAHDGYHDLITTLHHMFNTTKILWAERDDDELVILQQYSEKCHVLTYQDKEGDWLMVGDVPWEMFLSTVKRLKITTFDKCLL